MHENPEGSVPVERNDALADTKLEQDLREQTAKIPCFHVTGIAVENGIATVSLRGKILDEGSIRSLGEILFAIAQHPDVRGLALDFRKVDYISAATLGKYVGANKILLDRNQPALGISGMRPSIHEVFKITRLSQYFIIHKDLSTVTEAIEEARQKLRQASSRTEGSPQD